MSWTQVYDPAGIWWVSTLIAALPILVLFTLLAGLKVKPHWCAIAAAFTAVMLATLVFKMPALLAASAFAYGVAYGILKIAWIVLAAVYLYDISVETGQFEIMKESIAGITPDRRLQVLLVAFCFGAFIEGAAGFGAPVAIAGAFMIGLGFRPFHAAALNLIANTAPVAWGAIGTPVHALAAVSGLPESDLSAMIGRILPFTAVIVPFWLVRTMVSWSETFEVLPAILVVGISFAGTQYVWSNYRDSNLVDIMAGVVSILCTVIFLRFWKPKRIWRFDYDREGAKTAAVEGKIADDMGGEWNAKEYDGYVAPRKYPLGTVLKAWMPFAVLSLFVLAWGLPSVKLAMNKATTPAFIVVQGGRQSASWRAGMELAVSAQRDYAGGASGEQADSGKRALRFQLALGDGQRLFFGRDLFRIVAGSRPIAIDENILADAGAHAAGNDRDFVHAGFRIRDALFGAGCGAGPGVHAHGMALSIFWHVFGLVRRGIDWQRYFIERAVWKLAAHHFAAVGN